MNFAITRNKNPVVESDRQQMLNNPAFGRVFTDHMVTLKWTRSSGWHDGRVMAREPFSIDPASAVLHYGQEIFEGMKAYRTDGGGVALFRPELNATRFSRSAKRLAMPELPEHLFLEAVEHLVRVDNEWIPGGDGSLYLCPFMFANESFLGVKPAAEYVFCVIACPVGSYFSGGDRPLKVWVSEKYSRAGPGGTGASKCGGNYAASLVAQADAIAHQCDQVVFLDAVERRWVEELGGMNIFFVMNDAALITHPLDGTILPGITRASIIELAKANGINVLESRYALEDWRTDAASGRLREAFACGTAAVVVSIGEVHDGRGFFRVGDGVSGPVCRKIKDELVSIQRGRNPERSRWLRMIR